jgi:hypothetical protein
VKQEVFEVLEVIPYQEDRYRLHLRLRCGCGVRVVVHQRRVSSFPRGKRQGRGDTTVHGTYACPVDHPTHRGT